MTTHDFATWLHGFTELTGGQMPTEAQWKMIVEHLDLCFNKVTPILGSPKIPELRVGIPTPVGPRVLTPKEAGAELAKILVKDRAEKEAAEKEKDAAEKAEAFKKEAERQSRIREQNEKIVDTIRKAAEKSKEENEQKRLTPTPFFPQPPQPYWLSDPNWPGGIAYNYPPGLDPRLTLTC